VLRDDERWSTDRITMTQRLIIQEYGRRMLSRGLIDEPDDHFFLTLYETYALSDAGRSNALTRAKIAARRRNFEKLYTRQFEPPAWLQHGRSGAFDDVVADDADGVSPTAPRSGRPS
jgi:hypothetical protein